MAGALAWETLLRSGLSHSLLQRGCRRGWSVANHRGLTRVNIAARASGGTRRQLLLPIPWAPDQVDAIREAVLVLYEAVRDGEDPGEIITKLSGRSQQPRSSATITNSANHSPATSEPRDQSPTLSTATDWPEHVELYRRHKLHSGEVKQATWDRMYRPRMVLLLKLLDPTSVAAPQDSTALFQRVAEQWASQPGCRARQIQVQYTAAMLRWLVHLGHLSDQWSPPQDLSPYVGRSRQQKTITTPIAVEHILALLEAMPDSRWRLCFQLISAFGLRPEEIQHLELREGRLWCLYEKVAARGSTKPRPLRLLPSDDWAAEWNLERTFKGTSKNQNAA